MLNTRPRTRRSAAITSLWTALAALLCSAQPALAGGVSDVNKPYDSIPQALRSDEVLLPLLAATTPPPKEAGTREASTLLLSGMAGFDDAAAWVQADPQKAVLAALATVTKEKEIRKAFAFAQPYGGDLVDPKLVRDGLYTELGDPALLPGARFLYLTALDRLFCIANVEANRLIADKKSGEAVAVMANMLFFARQMCDRQFFAEVAWGLNAYIDSNERIRDIIYLDQKGPKSLTTADLRALLDRMDTTRPTTAIIDLNRVAFPTGDLIGFQQVVDLLFAADGSPDQSQFAATLARLGSSSKPLRIFSEAGRWSSAASGHANRRDTIARGNSAFNDWKTRWSLSWHDPLQSNTVEYESLDRKRFAAVVGSLPNMQELFGLRQIARTQIMGTRNAAAVVATSIERGSIPTLLEAVVPQWLSRSTIGVDPFNEGTGYGSAPTLKYFVPPSSGFGSTIVLANDSAFRVLFKNDTFVLYSIARDGDDQQASRIQNTARLTLVKADFLLYPPVQSLYRQSLIDLGQLK